MRTFFYYLFHPHVRYLASWLAAVITAFVLFVIAWSAFDGPRRPDGSFVRRGGNRGHVTIDFGGQWLLGRMLALGHGRHLYERPYQRIVFREGYPESEETPPEDRTPEEMGKSEAEQFMGWILGKDDPQAAQATGALLTPLAADSALSLVCYQAWEQEGQSQRIQQATVRQLGGPLYPPLHAFVMYPFGTMRPAVAYRSMQALQIFLAFLTGLGLTILSQGRLWWPLAAILVFLYPGYGNGIGLGQNSIIMLTILVWGWVLLVKGYPILGGIVWGLLAFKPVWGAAFFLAPFLMRQWSFCAAMVVSGALQAACTLPVVGLQPWLDWLALGSEATHGYHTDFNWVNLSRDLLNIPRRWLLDFKADATIRDTLLTQVCGWTIFVCVLELGVRIAILRRRAGDPLVGTGPAFMLLTGYFTCFHFMFYDVLLSSLAVLMLVFQPRKFLEPRSLDPSVWPWSLSAVLTQSPPVSSPRLIRNSLPLTLVSILYLMDFILPPLGVTVSVSAARLALPSPLQPLTFATDILGTPWTTFALLAIWAYCGWSWLGVASQPSGKFREPRSVYFDGEKQGEG